MNRKELIAKMAEKSGYTKADTEKVLAAFEDSVLEEVKSGGEVDLMKLMKISSKMRAERAGINPKTKERITIPAMCVPEIKVHSTLKEACKG